MDFVSFIEYMKDNFFKNIKIKPVIGSYCKNCPFYTKEESTEKKSGFIECWCESTHLTKDELHNNSNILDIWNYRKKDELISEGIFLTKDIDTLKTFKVTDEIIGGDGVFEPKDRQFIQVKKVIDNDKSIAVFEKSYAGNYLFICLFIFWFRKFKSFVRKKQLF